MKRIFILLAIIYYVNSATLCESITAPKKEEECFGKDVESGSNTCCFFQAPSVTSITKCYEIPKDKSQREQYIKEHYPAFTKYKYSCSDSVSTCNSITEPKSATECYAKEVQHVNNTCCMFRDATYENLTQCYEIPKNVSQRKQYIIDNYPEYINNKYTCSESSFGSFLEISLLLLGSLLLL